MLQLLHAMEAGLSSGEVGWLVCGLTFFNLYCIIVIICIYLRLLSFLFIVSQGLTEYHFL